MKFKVGEYVELLNTDDMGNDLGNIGHPAERAYGSLGEVKAVNNNAIFVTWEKFIKGKVNEAWYFSYRFDLAGRAATLGLIVDLEGPETNAGRKVCYWCGDPTMKLVLFSGTTEYCKHCDK